MIASRSASGKSSFNFLSSLNIFCWYSKLFIKALLSYFAQHSPDGKMYNKTERASNCPFCPSEELISVVQCKDRKKTVDYCSYQLSLPALAILAFRSAIRLSIPAFVF